MAEIKVVCRIKPHSIENNRSFMGIDDKCISISRITESFNNDKKLHTLSFVFDDILETSQNETYDRVAKRMVDDVLEGYNCTIFAYGQTCSGKTYTMSGYSNQPDKLILDSSLHLWNSRDQMGIIPRMVYDVLKALKAKHEVYKTEGKDIRSSIKLSYIEIYMERIKDLLNPNQDNLSIREDKMDGIYVENVTTPYVASFDQIYSYMKKGEINRTVMATSMNSDSSRSHAVLTFFITQESKDSKLTSKLTFVDLAGSESVEKAQTSGVTLEQGKYINRSLSVLGNVINNLVKNSSHIPYRDSKLTRLLTDSLGGNSKTCLILTISSDHSNVEETISTLRFGVSAKKIKNKPKKNVEHTIEEYKTLLTKAQEKIRELEMRLGTSQIPQIQQDQIVKDVRDILEKDNIEDTEENGEEHQKEEETEEEQEQEEQEEIKEVIHTPQDTPVSTLRKGFQDEVSFLNERLKQEIEANNKHQDHIANLSSQISALEHKLKQQDQFVVELTNLATGKSKMVGEYDTNLKLLDSYKIQLDFLKKQNTILIMDHRMEVSRLNRDIQKLKNEINLKSLSSVDDNFICDV